MVKDFQSGHYKRYFIQGFEELFEFSNFYAPLSQAASGASRGWRGP